MFTAFTAGRPTCADCQVEQRTANRINVVGQFKSLDGMEMFYDETGRFHQHDPNPFVTTFECTFGHRWDIEVAAPGCQGCGMASAGPEHQFIGIGLNAKFCVFDEAHKLIGISVIIHGESGRWMVPLVRSPAGAISLAWPT